MLDVTIEMASLGVLPQRRLSTVCYRYDAAMSYANPRLCLDLAKTNVIDAAKMTIGAELSSKRE